jgi:serine/threonine protein kinase
MTVIGLSGTQYQLDSKLLAAGGEGEIYRVLGGGTPKKVAKIYKSGVTTRELEEKLTIMVNRPPSSKVLTQVAWPLDILYNNKKQFCGFVMPELSINAELGEIYKYPSQLNISSQQKIIIAENICAVISEVHKAGYVFGDFNPRNIGVDKNNGTVAFLDTDTYHVADTASNKTHRCVVYLPGYLAPELIERYTAHLSANPSDKSQFLAKLPLPTFTRETDNFALAIHIFRLLMNGFSPYAGIKDTDSPSQASPGVGDDAVKRDNYCFKPGFKHLTAAVPSLDSFPQVVSDLFTRAFMFGRLDPKQRPTAVEWHSVLEAYEKTLVTCGNNKLHQYDRSNPACPLCEADERHAIATAPAISQKNYGSIVQAPVQYSGGGSSGGRPYTPSKNWWQKLSSGAKSAVVAASLSVVVFGFGAMNGWFSGNNNVPAFNLNNTPVVQGTQGTNTLTPAPNQQTPAQQPVNTPSPTDTQQQAQSPAVTQQPEVTQSPAETQQPDPTQAPTPEPAPTQLPVAQQPTTSTSNDNTQIVQIRETTEFAFTPSRSGIWTFRTSENGNSDPYLWIYDPNGNLLSQNDDGGPGRNAVINQQLTAGRQYTIKAGFSGTGSGSYTLRMSSLTGSIPSEGGSVQVSESTDYTFTPNRTGLWTFRTSENGNSDPYLWIYDSNGNLLSQNDDGGPGRNAVINQQLTAGTQYTVRAGFSGTGSGSYTLTMSSLTGIISNEGGSVQVSEITDFTFTPNRTGFWTFRTSENGNSDPYLWIFDSSGSLLSQNDDGGSGRNALINQQLTAGTQYIIRAGFSGTGSGVYTLTANTGE